MGHKMNLRQYNLVSGQLKKEEEFWMRTLSGHTAPAGFPGDYETGPAGTGEKQAFAFSLEGGLFQRLAALGNNSDSRLFMILTAALDLLLQKYTGRRDIALGAPILKEHAGENTINTLLILRNSLPVGMTFKELLLHVRETLTEATRHQNFPVHLLFSRLEGGDTGGPEPPPLFRTAILLEDIHDAGIFDHAGIGTLFCFSKSRDRLEVVIRFDGALYREATIRMISRHFKSVLEHVLADVSIPLDAVDILSESEKQQLIVDFNRTSLEFPRQETADVLFNRQAAATPDHTAVIGTAPESVTGPRQGMEVFLTYRELDLRADRLALRLRREGVTPGSLVGMMMERSVEMIIATLAIVKAGGAYLPIDPSYPPARIRFILEDSAAKFLVTSRPYGEITRVREFLFPAPGGPSQALESGETVESVTAPEAPVYVIYTSGTTGNPKGAVIRHRNLVNLSASHRAVFGEGPGDRFSQVAGIGFDAAVAQVWPALLSGAAVAPAPDATRVDAESMQRWLISNNISISFQPTAVAEWLLDLPWPGSGVSLRVLKAAGDRLTRYPSRPYPFRLYNLYGPTEDTVWTTFAEVPVNPGAQSAPHIGKPVANKAVYILSENGQLRPPGVPGELCIAGEGVALGYLNRPELTAEKFLEAGSRKLGAGKKIGAEGPLYRTGDLARRLPDGNIEFIGRIDSQVKIRGFRIEPGEIENQLLRLPHVKQACVTAAETGAGEKQLAAYIVPAPAAGETFSVETCKERLAEVLPGYMVPNHVILLETFPLTHNGKIDRRALPAPTVGTAYTAPRGAVEETLVNIWSRVLSVPRSSIGIDDNFFQLGGHSLNAGKTAALIHRELDVKIPLPQLFKTTVIRDLAHYIETQTKEAFVSIPPAPKQATYPLSSAQRRLYFLQQMEPAGTAYNLPMTVEIDSPADARLLEQAFKKVIQRHESLRTSFEFISGQQEPVQRIQKTADFKIPVHRINADTVEALYPRLRDFVRPFELSEAPLLRAEIFSPTSSALPSLLAIDMHHIISDGVSLRILIRDFVTCLRGESPPTPGLQYKDFAQWQSRRFAEGDLEKQENYWMQVFQTGVPVLDLPTDVPRPPVKQFDGGIEALTIPSQSTAGLKALALREGTTLFMLLLAVYNIFLSRLSGQTDIVTGTPVAGREHDDLSGMLGVFINTLPIRNYPTGERPFDDFLKDLTQQCLSAFENQEYPVEDLVDRLGLERDVSRTPLFDVTFALENDGDALFETGAAAPQGIRTHDAQLGPVTSKFDLTLVFTERDRRIEGLLHYCTHLFRRDTVKRFTGYILTLVNSILDDPARPLSDLTLLPPDERKYILEDFNRTAAPYPQGKTIHRIFEEHAAKRPDHIAVVETETGRQFSYRRLDRTAGHLAGLLRTRGVKPGSVTAILVDKGAEMVAGILGILKAGGAYLPLDPTYPRDRLQFMMEDSGVSLCVTQTHHRDVLGVHAAENLYMDDLPEPPGHDASAPPPPLTSPRDLAYIIYTSGSTGKPKGALLEHRGVANLSAWQARAFHLDCRSHILQAFSYSFDGAVGETFMAMLNGATLVMFPLKSAGPEKLMSCINAYQINLGVFVPSMLRRMAPTAVDRPGRLTIVSVGEACSMELARTWAHHCIFVNGYGPTETTVYSHTRFIDPTAVETERSVPIGIPIDNYASYILDPYLNPVPVGSVGEIYISGIGMARGYHNRTPVTQERFIPNPFFLEDKFIDYGDVVFPGVPEELEAFRRAHVPAASPPPADLDVRRTGRIHSREVLNLVKDLDKELFDCTNAFIGRYCEEPITYNGFCRYLYEGLGNTYSSRGVNKQTLEGLLDVENFEGLKGIDFGFGNGEILQVLEANGADVTGLDLSPFFVQHARAKGLKARMVKMDIHPGSFQKESGIAKGSQDFALSTLVLDRIETPGNFIKNLLASLKDNGTFAIQTLLPIRPVDDGDVETPIIYTPERNQVTPGNCVEEDKMFLTALLYELGARDIRIRRLPFAVSSNDGVQDYTMWSFAGIKTGAHRTEPDAAIYVRMYKTGDLGRYLPNGDIDFTGRVDHQVKIRGFRIELEEIESRLLEHPEIKETLVTAKEDQDGDKYLCAYIVPHTGAAPSAAQLRPHLLETLPPYMVPAHIMSLDHIPLTPNGKADMKRLPTPEINRDAGTYVPPRDPVEEALVRLWAGVLDTPGETTGIHDDFFVMGGHSLKVTNLAARIHETLDVKIPLVEIFKTPTISGMAQYIRHAVRDRFAAITAAETRDFYPLSSSQRRLYALNKMDETSLRYNMPQAMLLVGKPDVERLEQAFQGLIQRHEILRTAFVILDDEPVQIIQPEVRFHIHYREIPESAAPREVLQFLRPFELHLPPLLRAGLFNIGRGRHIFVVDMYHIVSDGISAGILVNDFLAIYNREPLPPLKLQYKDFALWQNHSMNSMEIHRQETYWLERFKDGPPALNLPVDQTPDRDRRFDEGGIFRMELRQDVAEKLYGTANETSVTIYTLLLAAFNIFLAKYTNTEDIVLGVPSAGRRHADLQNMLGMFVNMLPMRNIAAENKTFAGFLREVNQNALDAYENQDYPFEELVKNLGIVEHERNPLCNTVFVMRSIIPGDKRMEDLEVQSYSLNNNTVKFDLQLEIVENKTGKTVSMEWNYPYRLFKTATVENMSKHYVEILEQVLENTGIFLKDISISHHLLTATTNVFEKEDISFGF